MMRDERLIIIKVMLEHVFDRIKDESGLSRNDYEDAKSKFIFNMTDWTDDLNRLHDLFIRVEEIDDEHATRVVVGFLCHALPHLRKACVLLLDEEISFDDF